MIYHCILGQINQLALKHLTTKGHCTITSRFFACNEAAFSMISSRCKSALSAHFRRVQMMTMNILDDDDFGGDGDDIDDDEGDDYDEGGDEKEFQSVSSTSP